MSNDLSSLIESRPSANRSRTSSCNSNDLTEENINGYSILSSNKQSKTVKLCTLCGRYEGLRSVPKPSLLSFYL
jgi:hypothetical protein